MGLNLLAACMLTFGITTIGFFLGSGVLDIKFHNDVLNSMFSGDRKECIEPTTDYSELMEIESDFQASLLLDEKIVSEQFKRLLGSMAGTEKGKTIQFGVVPFLSNQDDLDSNRYSDGLAALNGSVYSLESAKRHEKMRSAISNSEALPKGAVIKVAQSSLFVEQSGIEAPGLFQSVLTKAASIVPVFGNVLHFYQPGIYSVSNSNETPEQMAIRIFGSSYKYDENFGRIWNDAAKSAGIPVLALYAISLQESGMRHDDGSMKPWPWTLNCNKPCPYGSMRFRTEQDARVSLNALMKAGWENIDVGMMQVNVYWHMSRFPSKDFLNIKDNLEVGATILRESLQSSGGNLHKAFQIYHAGSINDKNEKRAENYGNRVMRWGKATNIAISQRG